MMALSRRGFLGRLAAASAAMAVASKAGAIVAAPSPARKLCDAQQMVLDLLDECRIIEVSGAFRVDGVKEYSVTYRHDAGVGVGEFKVPLRDGRMIPADRIRDYGVPKSMSITKFIQDEVIDMNKFDSRVSLLKPVVEIVIEWVVA
jgi:hypothetical protein